MQGLWLENQTLELRQNLPIPEPPPGEALVRVLRAGICNTDLELLRGYYPYNGILGHEFVGVVEQGPENLIDRRVVGEINAACGWCRFCKTGQPTHCENRTVLGIVNRNGAFADYLILPIKNLHRVPDNISTDVATFTEPVAAALEIQQQVEIKPSDSLRDASRSRVGGRGWQVGSVSGANFGFDWLRFTGDSLRDASRTGVIGKNWLTWKRKEFKPDLWI